MKQSEMTIHKMQNLNRETIQYIISVIKAGMNLREIRTLCEKYLLANGADSFWYWDVAVFQVVKNNSGSVLLEKRDKALKRFLP